MNVENAVLADESKLGEFFKRLNPDEPFIMVNLLKFKEKAEYKKDEVESDLSGAEAYQKYLDEVKPLLENEGARLVNDLDIFDLLIGKVEELWDRILLVRYPSKQAFQKILTSQEFRAAQKHRFAGLAGQLNIATKVNVLAE